MHVQDLDEEAGQRIVVIEGLLHCFHVKTKAREQELHQQFVESYVAYSNLMEDVHELCQFAIVVLALCTSCVDLLEHNLHNHHTKVVQTLASLEALAKGVSESLKDITTYLKYNREHVLILFNLEGPHTLLHKMHWLAFFIYK